MFLSQQMASKWASIPSARLPWSTMALLVILIVINWHVSVFHKARILYVLLTTLQRVLIFFKYNWLFSIHKVYLTSMVLEMRDLSIFKYSLYIFLMWFVRLKNYVVEIWLLYFTYEFYKIFCNVFYVFYLLLHTSWLFVIKKISSLSS